MRKVRRSLKAIAKNTDIFCKSRLRKVEDKMKKGSQGLCRKIKTEFETVKVKFNEENKKAEPARPRVKKKIFFQNSEGAQSWEQK